MAKSKNVKKSQREEQGLSKNRQKEFPFTLPIGYSDEQGKIHREVVLRKMTGREEAVMAEPMFANNPGKLITELLYNCIVRFGDLGSPSRKIISQLYSQDRVFLLVKLRSITFGPELETGHSCPSCGTVTFAREDLEGLPCREWESGAVEIEVELEDGFEYKDKVYQHMVFRPPQGDDEEKIADIARRNIIRAKNSLLVRCLKRMGDLEPHRFQAMGTMIFEDLTLLDRRLIDRALEEKLPGVNLTRDVQCSGCGRAFQSEIDLENFLYPE